MNDWEEKDTNEMLYTISAEVIHGEGYGKKLGFPTVNLDVDEEKQREFPKDGVYGGIALLRGKEYMAAIVVGPNGKLEAHLIGFKDDAYGEYVTLKIEKFIREYKNFDTEEELINQIKKDLKQI